jgi:hypothetical protein
VDYFKLPKELTAAREVLGVANTRTLPLTRDKRRKSRPPLPNPLLKRLLRGEKSN